MSALLGPELALPFQEVPETVAKDERFTPWPLFSRLHGEFCFTIDVAACVAAAKLPRFYTREQNGLSKSWRGERVFCNPPWSCIPLWLEKTWTEIRTGCPFAFMLLPADRTDRPWWSWYVEPWRDRQVSDRWKLTTRFLPKRTHFGTPEDPDAKRRGRPECGLVALIWETSTC